jgi:predicted dehydrogenase
MIGVGDVAERKSGPAFSMVEDSVLVAVACRTPDRARDFADRHGVPEWHPDAAALVADPQVDAVYVATPPDAHESCARLAAKAGKPVYLEKPMARSGAECDRIVKACKRAKVPLSVAYYRRRLPKFMHARKLIDAGEIGEIKSVGLRLYQPPRDVDRLGDERSWRTRPEIAGAGGYLMDMGSHQLDLLDYLLGPLEDVRGNAANRSGLYPVEDTFDAEFRFAGGAIGRGEWRFTAAPNDRADTIEIAGADGSLVFSTFDDEPLRLVRGGETKEFDPRWPRYIQQPMIQAVVDCLLGRGPNPCDGPVAARTNRVIEAILAPGAR